MMPLHVALVSYDRTSLRLLLDQVQSRDLQLQALLGYVTSTPLYRRKRISFTTALYSLVTHSPKEKRANFVLYAALDYCVSSQSLPILPGCDDAVLVCGSSFPSSRLNNLCFT